MKFNKILGAVCLSMLAGVVCLSAGCGGGSSDDPEVDLSTLEAIYEYQQDTSMEVSATSDKIQIDVSSTSKSGNVKIVSVSAYQYLEGDNYNGLSEDIVSLNDATVVQEFSLSSSTTTIVIDRYSSTGYDGIYNKYYLVSGTSIIKGPVYTTEIEALVSDEPTLDITSKKGLLGEDSEAFEDLNCSYVTLNFEIDDLIYPNEIFEDGEETSLSHPESAIEFVSNGKTFYFKSSVVDYYDRLVSEYYSMGASITAIVYAPNNGGDWETFPQKLTYGDCSTDGTILMALNTSNSYGFEYFVAVIEFLTDRYTANNFENGYISSYVIGNEIDYAKDYNRISEKAVSLDVYMEEYSRLLRLANLAAKKYHADITVQMPITQAWAEKGYTNSDEIQPYAPKDMTEWLNLKSKIEGDYDWGLAPHSYTYGLASSEVLLMDTMVGSTVGMTGDYNTSSKITFSNIEILDEYLSQEFMQYNGTTRSIYLTESGVSSNTNDDETQRAQQAGSIAAVWYKISQIDSIKAWFYYRVQDAEGEAASSARLGLKDLDGNCKPAYELYKYIDTQYSSYFADQYISYISYVATDGSTKSYGSGISSYLDCLDVFGTGYDFSNFDWNKANPVTVETVYEFEDTIDLGDLSFESITVLYDGDEHSISATNVPEGVEVSYDVTPTRTTYGTTTVLATFTKDGEVVGHRKASITITAMQTNKTTYNLGENIYVTTLTKDMESLTAEAWVGIFDHGANVGNSSALADISYYYYYFNSAQDGYIRTECIQDGIFQENKGSLKAGQYDIYYFINGGYDYAFMTTITILPSGQTTDSIDLSNVSFTSTTYSANSAEQTLTISGTLPDGVSVEYQNNSLTEVGTANAVAIFKYDGEEIERRYAVLTIVDASETKMTLNKSSYVEGEDILVTVCVDATVSAKTWWVGVYLKDDVVETDYSIYWYYVIDDSHVSGGTYNIKEQEHNGANTGAGSRADYADLPAGEYKMVLFNTSGYSVAETIYFTISEA